jgi:hypothetical protein
MKQIVLVHCTQLINTRAVTISIQKYISGDSGPDKIVFWEKIIYIYVCDPNHMQYVNRKTYVM